MTKIFDIHIHATTKSFLYKRDKLPSRSPWDCLNAGKVIPIDEIANLSDDRLDSQCSLTQLSIGGAKIAIATMHAIEPDYLKLPELRTIVDITNVDDDFVKAIENREYTSYRYIQEELEHLIKASSQTRGNYRMTLPTSSTQLANTGLHLLVSIEGGHNFLEKENPTTMDYADSNTINQILNRFESYIARHKGQVTFTFLTLTHIAHGPMCTQAFAYAKDKVSPQQTDTAKLFFPKGPAGIRSVGNKLIEKVLAHNMHIDVKHMSYYSRISFYKKLRNEYSGKNIPIIASHVGAAGCRFADVKDKLKTATKLTDTYNAHVVLEKGKGILDTYFYPLSLNLFDEEIKLIVDSGGIIGISLDERIVGVKDAGIKKEGYDSDYYHWDEHQYLISASYEADHNLLFGQMSKLPFPASDIPGTRVTFISKITHFLNTIFNANGKNHLHYFINNLLRFVYAGGPQAWKQITIGSDYDGMIDALDNYKTATNYPKLKQDLCKELPKILSKIDKYEELFFVDKNNLKQDIENKVEDIMYNNGERFVKKYYMKQEQLT